MMSSQAVSYYQHVLPGEDITNYGNRRVSADMQAMDSKGYQEFETAHDSYLGTAGLNLFLVTCVITVLTHLVIVLVGQAGGEINSSTIQDIFQGPLLIILIAGLTGMGVLFGLFGVPTKYYFGLYIPFGLVVMGIGAWAALDDAGVNPFTLPGVSDGFNYLSDQTPNSMIWIVISCLVAITAVLLWMQGKFRLDAMTFGGTGSIVILAFVGLFTYGLSKIFGLVLKTLDFLKFDEDSPAYLALYVMSALGLIFVVVSTIKFLDTLLHYFGGHINSVFSPPSGVGASKAIIETQRAFQLSFYAIILITAALIWRRRNGLQIEENTDGESLRTTWASIGGLILVIPVIALVSEGIKEWFGGFSIVYDFLRTVIISGIIIYVGIGYIPWNYETLALAGVVGLILFLQFLDLKHNYDKPLVCFFLVAMFTFGRLSFRAEEQELFEANGGKEPVKDTWMIWVKWVVAPAVLAALLTIDGGLGTYTEHCTRIYLCFVLLYTFTLDFVDELDWVPIKDSPYYNIVPENEAASLAVDGLILFGSLMIATGIWAIVTPKNFSKMSREGLIPLGFGPVNIISIVYYIAVAAVCVYGFINVRHNRELSSFARKSQAKMEKWYMMYNLDSELWK